MNAPHPHAVTVLADPRAVAEAAAERVVARIADASGHPAICLTGGSTPKRLYELLATPAWRAKIPWPNVHWFMTDDRFVREDDALSNGGMARNAFLDACAPPDNVHLIPTALASVQDAARIYHNKLEAFGREYREGEPLFDLVLLGVGPDGHTASLFPNAPALAEQTRWVTGVDEANVAPFIPRVSLTLPGLAQTREILFLATGHDKRDILRRVFAGEDLPAGHARAADGETLWLIDTAADPKVEG